MKNSCRTENIRYRSDGIVKFFDGHRDKWDDFYPSEKWAIERVAREHGMGDVLDVGCALGGLGQALLQKVALDSYYGIDINPQAIALANQRKEKFSIPARFECEDILKVNSLKDKQFDTVFSLSCADWNIDTHSIIKRCWEYVRPGGNLIISLRLTSKPGINDITRSYQPISIDDKGRPIESANYVVFNIDDFMNFVKSFDPGVRKIAAYGYWGKPAANAVTIYDRLVFAVFIITKSLRDDPMDTITELSLPEDLFQHRRQP